MMVGSYTYGMVNIEWLGHASFRISTQGKIIYIDPYVIDENAFRADLIIVTHEHHDHCAVDNIQKLLKEKTIVIAPQNCLTKLSFVPRQSLRLLSPNDSAVIGDVQIKTIPAYNVNKFRAPNIPYHPKNFGFGVVFNFAGVKIYHAGDTDFVPEMHELAEYNIDVALVPVGGKYTMDPKEAVQAIQVIKPKVAIPMHWGTNIVGTQEDADKFKKLIGAFCEVQVL
jgi:L-ascorbate metabolism protein UlaG (beta-lactamase superfamily)